MKKQGIIFIITFSLLSCHRHRYTAQETINRWHGKNIDAIFDILGYPENQIIYTPHLYCPHIIANNLDAKLLDLQNKKIIDNYTLQIAREKKHYASISNYPFEPKKKTFQDLIDGKHNEIL